MTVSLVDRVETHGGGHDRYLLHLGGGIALVVAALTTPQTFGKGH